MCEYCGCQDLAPISELTREHDLVLSLVCEVRIARSKGDGPRMAELASRIAAVLDPHTEVEEHGLFPALAADFPDQISILEAEHQQIAEVLGEASSGLPEDPAWPDRLAAALALLRAHIYKEQDGVFPAALASLRTADWEAMEDIRTRVGSLLRSPARPSDRSFISFWPGRRPRLTVRRDDHEHDHHERDNHKRQDHGGDAHEDPRLACLPLPVLQ